MVGAVSENEVERLEALRRLEILDTEVEPEFDELAGLAAAVCEAPMALLTFVDETRQWSKASFGVDMKEMPREFSFCTHSLRQTEPMVVEDTAADERFAANPWVTGELHIRFYAGMPVSTPDGFAVGGLCVMDREPRKLSHVQKNLLVMLARQVNARLELRLQRRQLKAALEEADYARTELLAGEERFRAFMDNSPFVSFIKDAEGRLLFYSKRFADRFGISIADCLGKTDFDLWPPEDAEIIRQHDLEVLRDGTLKVLDEEVRDKAGVVSYWRTHKFPFRNSRGEKLLGGIAVETTETLAKENALHRTQAELQSANTLLKELVVTDALTGLGNRRVLEERLAAEMSAARRGRCPALLMLDIDHFKHRNDTFGHQDGDDVLRQLGALMRRLVRGNEVAARYGGEEFTVLMPNATEDDAAGLAARLLTAIRSHEWAHAPITVSIGVAGSGKETSASELVAAADMALYAAKAAGRDCFKRRSDTK